MVRIGSNRSFPLYFSYVPSHGCFRLFEYIFRFIFHSFNSICYKYTGHQFFIFRPSPFGVLHYMMHLINRIHLVNVLSARKFVYKFSCIEIDKPETVISERAIWLEVICIDQITSLYIISNKTIQGFSFKISSDLIFHFLAVAFFCTTNSSFAGCTSHLF